MLFSDESSFQQFTVRKNHACQPMEERFNEKYTICTMKHFPTQITWGTMSANGTAGICFLKPGTTMNGVKYAELLKDKLPTHMAIHQLLNFMHDGAPCLQSKIVKQFLTKNHIKKLDWTGNNPDLNPIKNLWSKMKNLVSQKQQGSFLELVKIIKEVWVKKISEKYCESLTYIMPHQLQAVIDACGGDTKYLKCMYLYTVEPRHLYTICSRSLFELQVVQMAN